MSLFSKFFGRDQDPGRIGEPSDPLIGYAEKLAPQPRERMETLKSTWVAANREARTKRLEEEAAISYDFHELNAVDLEQELRGQLRLTSGQPSDPEATFWNRSLQQMLKSGGNKFSYPWGGREVNCEIFKFGDDEFIFVKSEYW